MDISFDSDKRETTLRERGLDFADAGKVFAGQPTATRADDRQDYGEDRFITVGYLAGRCVVVVWTPGDGGRRIIPMRYAHERGERRWIR